MGRCAPDAPDPLSLSSNINAAAPPLKTCLAAWLIIGKVLGIDAKENDVDSDVVPNFPTQRRLKAHDTAEEVPPLTTKRVLDQVNPTVLVFVDKMLGAHSPL